MSQYRRTGCVCRRTHKLLCATVPGGRLEKNRLIRVCNRADGGSFSRSTDEKIHRAICNLGRDCPCGLSKHTDGHQVSAMFFRAGHGEPSERDYVIVSLGTFVVTCAFQRCFTLCDPRSGDGMQLHHSSSRFQPSVPQVRRRF